ncbi:MAG: penicillin-binding transpeptidase domain-containing protein [Acidobacteriaceae bacterium]|nr:penicillin-binding transpeptidase domain-containing protein [Acidobacteriaceae bacterium]
MSRLLHVILALVVAPLFASASSAQDSDLFSQAASTELMRRFGGGNLSWLMLDRWGRVVAENWPDADRTVAPGSLLKPFIAVAYGEQHGYVFPRVTCSGISSRCWLPRGHGRIGLEAALADSCNTYFLSLAGALNRRLAQTTFARFGLQAPRAPDADALIGLTDQWRETPITLASAYLKLASGPPEQASILAGMHSAAESGTARDVDLALGPGAALAKTGTAACSHHPRATADGFTVVLFPAAQPRVVLLVRMHGATGAQTAAQAGAMLRAIGMGIGTGAHS